MLTRILAAAGLLALAGPATAQDCRLALVLALDVSSSVDESEDHLQRRGLAAALLAPEVVRAFLIGEAVDLYVFEWSDLRTQTPLLAGWERVRSEDDLARIARVITSSHRLGSNRSTAIGAALLHAAEALSQAPACQVWTVDIASDGKSNDGPLPETVYRSPPFERVTVNALVIGGIGAGHDNASPAEEGRLTAWFEAEVLHGPGAFSLLADGYEDYERAMTAKLLRELEMPLVSGDVGGADAG